MWHKPNISEMKNTIDLESGLYTQLNTSGTQHGTTYPSASPLSPSFSEPKYYSRLAEWVSDRSLSSLPHYALEEIGEYYSQSRVLDFMPLFGILIQHLQLELCIELEDILEMKASSGEQMKRI